METLKPFLLVLAVIAAVSLACGPSPTEPPPPATEAPTDPPATEPPTEPPAPVAQEYFTEEFEGDISSWSKVIALNASEGDEDEAYIEVEDGRVVFDLGKWLIGYVFYEAYEYEDVRIDVVVENRGQNINNVLLICRSSDEGHYLVNIANSGLYAMYAFNGDTDNYERIADGGSNKIKQGKEINEYTLICEERDLKLFINGNETRVYTDNKFIFRKGNIGIGVASEDQLPVKLEIDSVTISQP
ncbi:MAG: hypothetical protein JXA13_09935 [Anaerolineales bacterium]|nr:hypothetical protein [Anaerolineales bacterium]